MPLTTALPFSLLANLKIDLWNANALKTFTSQEREIKVANPKSTAQIAGHPIHPMVVPFPIAFYFGTFASDLIYALTGNLFWAEIAFWLLVSGVVMSAVAGTVGLVDFVGEKSIRRLNDAWWHAGGNALVSIISITDLYLRYLDGPEVGSHRYIWLSLIVAALLIFTGWKGGRLVYDHHVGVRDVSEN